MRVFISILAIGLLFPGCKPKNTTTITSDDGKTKVTLPAVSTMETVGNDMQKKADELKKLAPMKLDDLKAMVPEEVMGMKRSSFEANSMMGFANADGEYKKDDTSKIKLTIMDCAGEAGSAFYTMSYWTKMNIQSENDEGYTKTVDFMGGKAVEEHKKYNNEYTLTFTANDRLLVTLHGENISLDALKDFAKKLNLKAT